MLYAGLDLSRQRLDVHLLDEDGRTVEVTAVRPDTDALRTLVASVGRHGQAVTAAIESMNGARFVHDQLELAGWDVAIADALKVKGLAPLAAKTDKIDAWVLAELSRRELVPAIWLPDPSVRAERERARFRLHLVRHRTALKNRIHATLIAFGHPVPVSDLFGTSGRELLGRLAIPEPWATTLATSLRFVDDLDREIDACAADLRAQGADHPYVPLLRTAPGIAWVLGYTIASEIGDITRFANPKKLTGYTGLCPFVRQSGRRDDRGPLAKNGPKYLRWALIEAATHAARHPVYRERYERTKQRLGKQRGAKVARVDIARELSTAIWHMLTKNQPFAPGRSPVHALVA
ncbi:MAG: IS110 family RNA-guided transposase [Candidatus Limnocylindrales bacterium]